MNPFKKRWSFTATDTYADMRKEYLYQVNKFIDDYIFGENHDREAYFGIIQSVMVDKFAVGQCIDCYGRNPIELFVRGSSDFNGRSLESILILMCRMRYRRVTNEEEKEFIRIILSEADRNHFSSLFESPLYKIAKEYNKKPYYCPP